MSVETTIPELASNVDVVRAYIGPGSGLAAFGSLLAVIGAVALVIVGFVWYPVKRLVRARKSARAKRAAETPTP